MVDAARIAHQIRRRTEVDLDRMADEVTAQYLNREFQCQTVPMEKRGRNTHRQPQTALIALAAKRKILKRQVVHLLEWRLRSTDEIEEDVKELNSLRNYLSDRGTFRESA